MIEPIMKKRRIRLDRDVSFDGLNVIKTLLKKINGIMDIKIYNRACLIKIMYNLGKVNFIEIEKIIVESGFILSEKWTDKFRRAFVKFKEQNELDHLTARPSPCCSDPRTR